jgi:hypothetical protein
MQFKLNAVMLFATLAFAAGLSMEERAARKNRLPQQTRNANENIYVANDSGQDIYVMAGLTPGWAIADFIVDIALIVTPFDELSAVAEAVGLPAALKTFGDIFTTLQSAGKILNKASSASADALDKANQFVSAFQNTAVSTHIVYGDFQDVYKEDTLTMYLTPSGIAGMLGASTVSLLVMSADGKQQAMWDTGPDNSWIATGSQTIVRSKYGSIWQQDPASGSQDWTPAS